MYRYDLTTNRADPSVVSFARGDVNGDRVPENVYLTGIRTPDSPFIQNITLVIQNGVTGRFTAVPFKANAGYNPALFLGDFTGDGADDIFIRIDSGGSGAITYDYIFSFINNIAGLLFDFDVYNRQYQYDVIYKDYYKVEVTSRINNTKYLIDITYKGADYLHEIYDANGRLKNPISGFVNPLSGLYPVDFDSNKVYELLAFQKIAGRYNADSLGYVQNILKWKNGAFVLDNQFVAIFGSQVQAGISRNNISTLGPSASVSLPAASTSETNAYYLAGCDDVPYHL